MFLGGEFSGLSISCTHTGYFTAGEQGATYQLTVGNPAYLSSTSDVVVTDTLPAGFTAMGMGGNGWSCTLPILTCTRSDALAGGSSYPPITVTVSVSPSAPVTTVNNIVKVTTNGVTNTATDPTAIGQTSSAGPNITLVANAEGGSPVIAANTWVLIKGSNLAPSGVSSPGCAPGYCWQGSDFVNNQLPTALQGVSVILNEENAFIYYISPGQINILTPPDLAYGPVTVQVNNNGTVSQAFTAQSLIVSDSFFVFNGGPYVAARHLDYSIVGPTTLFPGLSTPAQPGETIILYGNGFGLTTAPVMSGSETQSGVLSSPPSIQIGTTGARVGFYGLVSPGEYQFNVTIPANAQSGDNPISVSYIGSPTQTGTLLTIQKRRAISKPYSPGGDECVNATRLDGESWGSQELRPASNNYLNRLRY